MDYTVRGNDQWGNKVSLIIRDVCATAIYTPQDDKKLLEKHEATLDKMEKDPECSEEDKERIWRAIQEISRGY